ncbi:unnamed protein product [Gongylonema pulchrum]|uniref:Ig-like domain-containing protein n=1 Tax=Gongylonema pulchrum TaxID=637853 RepID=A0A183D1Z8_9BILA|nr:unnamed protein product [Gongylonema pulchrum]
MLYIDDLRISDSGDYECILTNKDDARDIRHSVYHLQVSPTKGQLKFVDASNDIELEEGGTIRLYHIARSFPDDEYDSEWRKYSKTMTTKGDFVEKVENGVKSELTDDLHEDELVIPNATVENSAVYQLVIRVAQDFVYRKNWTVSVRPRVVVPFITVYDQFEDRITSDVLVDSKIVMDEVDIHISEVQSINATYNTIKPDPSLTENSDIYEKDRLELICILPLNDEL